MQTSSSWIVNKEFPGDYKIPANLAILAARTLGFFLVRHIVHKKEFFYYFLYVDQIRW